MKHFSYDEWLNYVKNDITENIREEFENHLYTCDQCLEHYLQAMAEHESSLPRLTNESNFTDLVMTEVSKQSSKQSIKKQKENTKSLLSAGVLPLFSCCSCNTIIDVLGCFSIARYLCECSGGAANSTKKPSITEGVIDKTFAWMDSLDKKEANKK